MSVIPPGRYEGVCDHCGGNWYGHPHNLPQCVKYLESALAESEKKREKEGESYRAEIRNWYDKLEVADTRIATLECELVAARSACKDKDAVIERLERDKSRLVEDLITVIKEAKLQTDRAEDEAWRKAEKEVVDTFEHFYGKEPNFFEQEFKHAVITNLRTALTASQGRIAQLENIIGRAIAEAQVPDETSDIEEYEKVIGFISDYLSEFHALATPSAYEKHSAESDSSNLLCALLQLAEEWEKEGDSLDNPQDDAIDRQAGRIYKFCARELRKISK